MDKTIGESTGTNIENKKWKFRPASGGPAAELLQLLAHLTLREWRRGKKRGEDGSFPYVRAFSAWKLTTNLFPSAKLSQFLPPVPPSSLGYYSHVLQAHPKEKKKSFFFRYFPFHCFCSVEEIMEATTTSYNEPSRFVSKVNGNVKDVLSYKRKKRLC